MMNFLGTGSKSKKAQLSNELSDALWTNFSSHLRVFLVAFPEITTATNYQAIIGVKLPLKQLHHCLQSILGKYTVFQTSIVVFNEPLPVI
jgi:hypothetical protein